MQSVMRGLIVVLCISGLFAIESVAAAEVGFVQYVNALWKSGQEDAVRSLAQQRLRQDPNDLVGLLLELEYQVDAYDLPGILGTAPRIVPLARAITTDNAREQLALLEVELQVVEELAKKFTDDPAAMAMERPKQHYSHLFFDPYIEALQLDGYFRVALPPAPECDRTGSTSDPVTCRLDALQIADQQLYEAVRTARHTRDRAGKVHLDVEQKAWREVRTRLCGLDGQEADLYKWHRGIAQDAQQTDCLLRATADRVSALRQLALRSPVQDRPGLAYLIDSDGGVQTLDTNKNEIVDRRSLKEFYKGFNLQGVEGSARDNLLLVVEPVMGGTTVVAFDLRTLQFRQSLGIHSTETPKILIPAIGPHFFVKWTDRNATGHQSATRLTRFDRKTLAMLDDIPNPPTLWRGEFEQYAPVLSTDGHRLYLYQEGESAMRIDAYETGELRHVATYDLRAFVAPDRGGTILDIQGDRVLISTDADAGGQTLFTVHLRDRTVSPRIVRVPNGVTQLTPTGDRILLAHVLPSVVPPEHVTVHEGRLRVYDVATGREFGKVDFPNLGCGNVQLHGEKAYCIAYGHEKIMGLSLRAFTMVQEIKVPGFMRLLFLDVPDVQ